MKLDEKTVVPLGWVIIGFTSMMGVTITGAFWVSTVNFRLQRIEQRLGILALENPEHEKESIHASRLQEFLGSGSTRPKENRSSRKNL